jgi:putative hydrolase of HD superfamily
MKRIVLGNTVVDHERVHRMFPEGSGVLEAIAIYQIENGKIAKAWLKVDEKNLDIKK